MKELICIVCPVGCRMDAKQEKDGQITVSGNGCRRGAKYAEEELLHPKRMVTSSVRVLGGDYPLVSIKTKESVPKESIGSVLASINQLCAKAPVAVGDVLLKNVANTGVDIVATRQICTK